MVAQGWGAYTMAWCIWYWDETQASSLRCRRHEREHCRQYLRWGVLMPWAYLACLAFTGYEDNPFEKAARAAALAWPE